MLSAAEEEEEEKETTTYGKRKGLEESKKGPRIRKYDKWGGANRVGVSGRKVLMNKGELLSCLQVLIFCK